MSLHFSPGDMSENNAPAPRAADDTAQARVDLPTRYRRETVNAYAVRVLAHWRKQGAPLVITPAEAWNLSGGLVGRPDNHHTEVRLSTAALFVATHSH